ncbi:MAG: hypothetical protein R6V57_01920 [Vicinamibacterales bacterium]
MTPTGRFVARAALLLLLPLAASCSSESSPTSASSDSPASSSPAAAVIEITIEVAPNVLNLQSEGQVVTIHTSLAYGSVVASSVTMNGVTISSSKADNQGQFVAKFVMEAIKDLPLKIGESNTLRIEGRTTTGASFWGSKAILVVNNTAGK